MTVCAQDRVNRFGDIVNEKMHLNETGRGVAETWEWLKGRYNNIGLDAWVIMPNHIHGIVLIVGADLRVRPQREDRKSNGHKQLEHQRQKENQPGGHAGPPLQEIIQWFKTMTTNGYINEVKYGRFPPFEKRIWQRSFYDHVIRDDDDLNRVREYIQNNPLRWALDEENPANRVGS